MTIENKVVVRFRDNRLVKGFTYDFNPAKDRFHVTDAEDKDKIHEIPMSLMKALFFVKTFEGNRDYKSPEGYSKESLKHILGKKVRVTFSDGEVLVGTTNGYDPKRQSFFIFPVETESNNERVLIISESTDKVEAWI